MLLKIQNETHHTTPIINVSSLFFSKLNLLKGEKFITPAHLVTCNSKNLLTTKILKL